MTRARNSGVSKILCNTAIFLVYGLVHLASWIFFTFILRNCKCSEISNKWGIFNVFTYIHSTSEVFKVWVSNKWELKQKKMSSWLGNDRNTVDFCFVFLTNTFTFYGYAHGLRTPGDEIAFTARPKINSHSQIFRYSRSIFCLPHRPKFSDFFDLCLHWVSVVRDFIQ